MSVMAHPGHDANPGHPQITISENTAGYTTATPRSRSNLQIKIVATVNGSSDIAAFDVGATLIDSEVPPPEVFLLSGTPAGDATGTVTHPDATKAEWIVTYDLSSDTSSRTYRVSVNANALDGNRVGAEGGNELTTMSLGALPSVLTDTATLTATAVSGTPGRYAITITFSGAGRCNPCPYHR